MKKILSFVIAVLFVCVSSSAEQSPEVAATQAKAIAPSAATLVQKKPVVAPENKDVILTSESKKGKVVSVSATAISVLYDTDANNEYEIMIPFSRGTKLAGYKGVSDIRLGDDVELIYEKAVEFKGKPNERSTKTLQKIRLTKRAAANALVSEGGKQ